MAEFKDWQRANGNGSFELLAGLMAIRNQIKTADQFRRCFLVSLETLCGAVRAAFEVTLGCGRGAAEKLGMKIEI